MCIRDSAQAQRILGEEQVFEQRMDDTNRAFRNNQLNRLAGGVCSAESAILYSEMLLSLIHI